jgi:tetratricopeptide (TPR) repeat protein/membrane protease YdiL (CAAX protease family)
MIIECLRCKSHVMPMRDGRCPGCRNVITDVSTSNTLSAEPATNVTEGDDSENAAEAEDSSDTCLSTQDNSSEEVSVANSSMEILERFELAWQHGAPELRSFLANEGITFQDASDIVLLSAMIELDLNHRWAPSSQLFVSEPEETSSSPREPDKLRLRDYVSRFPELGDQATLSTQLITAEFRVRLAAGDRPQLSEYTEAVEPGRVDEIIEILLPLLIEKKPQRPVLCRGILAVLGRMFQWLMLTAFIAAPVQAAVKSSDVPGVTSVFIVSGMSAFIVALAALGKFHPHDVRRVVGWRRPTWLHLVLCLLLPIPVYLLMNGVLSVVCWQTSVLAIDWAPYMDMYATLARQPLAIVLLVGCCLPAVAEEIFFRAFIGRGLIAKYGPIPGVLLTSLLFGLCHVMPDQAIYTFLLGIILHFVYLSSKSLVVPMLVHGLNNFMAFMQLRWLQSGEFDVTVGNSVYLPSGLLAVSAMAMILSLIVMYRTRVGWQLTGTSLWTPGFVSAETPPEFIPAISFGHACGQKLGFMTGGAYALLAITIGWTSTDWMAISYANQAVSLLDHGDDQQADLLSRRAVESAPGLAWTHAVRGHVLSNGAAYDRAKECCQNAIRLDPGIGFSHRVLGWIAFQENQFQNAVDHCSLALETIEHDAFTYAIRGAAQLELERFSETVRDCNQAIRRDPGLAWAYAIRGASRLRVEQLDLAKEDLSKSLELDPSYTYAWSQRARVRYELGQYDAAINDAKTALEQDPKDFDAQYYLALSLEETGDIDGAIVSLSACLENAGTDAATNDGVRLKRVNLLLQAERATEAMKDLEVLIQLYPEDEQIYESRRQAFHLLGDTENAKRDALLVEQKHEAAQVAEILSLNERGMHQRALDVANQLLVRCPDSVQGLAGRAASKWYLMKYPEALEDYTAALSRTPNDADMLANRGKLYHDTGEYEKSIADFTKAIELKPLNSGLYHGRASAWRQLGQPEKADADAAIAFGLESPEE